MKNDAVSAQTQRTSPNNHEKVHSNTQGVQSHLTTGHHNLSNTGDEICSLLSHLCWFVIESPKDCTTDLRQIWLHSLAESIHHRAKTVQHHNILQNENNIELGLWHLLYFPDFSTLSNSFGFIDFFWFTGHCTNSETGLQHLFLVKFPLNSFLYYLFLPVKPYYYIRTETLLMFMVLRYSQNF